MSSLYEIVGARLELQHKLEALGFDAETVLDTIEGNSTEIEAKITDYGYIIRNRTSFEAQMQDAIMAMQERLNTHLKLTASIESRLLSGMVACDISRIDCPAFSVVVKTNPAHVEIDAESIIPIEYWRTPAPKVPVPVLDKVKIKDALKQGLEVPGCHLQQDRRLSIE